MQGALTSTMPHGWSWECLLYPPPRDHILVHVPICVVQVVLTFFAQALATLFVHLEKEKT